LVNISLINCQIGVYMRHLSTFSMCHKNPTFKLKGLNFSLCSTANVQFKKCFQSSQRVSFLPAKANSAEYRQDKWALLNGWLDPAYYRILELI
jgi:hypothetical protein